MYNHEDFTAWMIQPDLYQDELAQILEAEQNNN